MNSNFKPPRPDKSFHTSSVQFQGDISRNVGNIRAVNLESKTVNPDHIAGMASAISESIRKAFGELDSDTNLDGNEKPMRAAQ